ncbi:MAG TPA: long-chain fatty acid--CoA ligase [Myxococcaceae bacterium]|jgi:hypothetical protein
MSFDVREILKLLDLGHAPEAGAPEWLRQSWEDPDGFIAALTAAQAGRGAPPPKSRPGQHYDFFHDLVIRHLESERIAFRAYDRLRGWQALSYRQLHDQAARRGSEWAEQGVKPGAKLCLVYNMGAELLISLAAALRLGACLSILPPQGTHFVSRRLEALAPDHIAAEPHQVPLLKGFEKLLLRSRGHALPGFTSYTYKPDEPVGLLFSPLVDPTDTPVPLLAADAWRGALCDGLLSFKLGPGDHLAAPGFHLLQHQPALFFATLLRGATFLHLELADLEHEQAPLFEHPLHALGVTPALRDILLRGRGKSLKNLSLWFRCPEERLDWQAWRAWVRQCGLTEVPHANVLIDSTAGGMVAGSWRHVGDIHTEALPAAGRSWTLRDLNMSGQEAAGDVGVLTLLPDKGRPPGYIVLSRIRQQYHYASTRDARKEGRVYPSAEVAAALADLPFVEGVSVVAVPTGGLMGHHRYVLLVFTGAETQEVAARESGARQMELRRRLELRMGAEFLPDRIEFYALYPRRKKGVVDDAWCRSQYLTGALHQKSIHPMFQALTAVRGHLVASEAKPGEDEFTQ